MKLKADTLPGVHERMALVKSQSSHGFVTNYFRQELMGSRIFSATTAHTLLFLNDEHDFFRLHFFTTDITDFEQLLRQVDFPGVTVIGYLTRDADEKLTGVFERCDFGAIASYCRMVTYRLPLQRPNDRLEYAAATDVDEVYGSLLESFNKYTDHLPTKDRLQRYVRNQWVIVNRDNGQIRGAVCFQLEGPRVNYNYIYNLSGNALDFLRLQNNFYGVMDLRGIRAGFLWINQTEARLAALHRSMGWQFDGLNDYFYLRS